jgi:DNA repair protein RecN (Recombination protein N)
VLQKLYIKNFAIIDELEIALPNGLIALTGETGAGKSIILGAIQLLIGARADSSSLYNKDEKCIIEAEFAVPNHKRIEPLLQEWEIDRYNLLLIRREISANGRSRAFINDTPVLLNQLEELGNELIDLHRQFDTANVKDADFQMMVIDVLANNLNELIQYKTIFSNWKQTAKEIQQLKQEQIALQKEQAYHQFVYNELDAMQLLPDEVENLEQQLVLLSSAEELKVSLAKTNFLLQDDEHAILSKLKQVVQLINNYSHNIKQLQPLAERLSSVQIELKDISEEINSLEQQVVLDEEALNKALERFNEGTRLLKKHHVQTTNELLAYKNEVENKLSISNTIDAKIAEEEAKLAALYINLQAKAQIISKGRNNIATQIEQNINEQLVQLGMPNAKFKIQLSAASFAENGADAVQYLLDANNTTKYTSLYKAASGGELSRIMLSIKGLLANATHLPTIIFDEIDTGISGEVAKKVGALLANLAHKHQLITVTHLPQIAAKATHHLYVYKQTNTANKVSTYIKLLSTQERINHIAEMLSGNKPSETALQAAKELLAIN